MLEFHVFAKHRLLMSSRLACASETVAGQMPFAFGNSGSPVAAVPMLALTLSTLKILFHPIEPQRR